MDTPERGDPGDAPTIPQSPTMPTGQVQLVDLPVVSDYEIREVIGRGGMGEVVLAHDLTMDRDVALKRMRSEQPSDEATARFLREARIQARLDHPAIVPVHELGVDREGRPFFTMKRLSGTTLADVMDSNAATLQRLLRAFVDVCNAIDFAHARGIVHRDLKPSNIMLGEYGEVYVLDWGVARVLEDEQPTNRESRAKIPTLDSHTQTGELLGTPGYMAPEQVHGAEVGAPADVYALGSILFEMLTTTTLHPRGHAALASTINPADTSARARTPERDLALELDLACAEALYADPGRRPSARALGDRIQSYLDGDRDLALRRQHSAKLTASGRAALAGGRRAEAVNLGGRALALDPKSDDAAELVISLVIDPPDELPPELAADLDRVESDRYKERSRRALIPYLAPFIGLPLIAFLHIANWPMLIGLYAALFLMLVLIFTNTRSGKVPLWAYLVANIFVIAGFSRLTGPFVLTPCLILAITLSLAASPWLNARPLLLLLWLAAAVVTPFALEWASIFEAAWKMTPDGVVSSGTIFSDRDSPVPLFVGNLAMILLIAMYARGMGRDRHHADRRLLIQRWHLLQLLPKAARAQRGFPSSPPP